MLSAEEPSASAVLFGVLLVLVLLELARRILGWAFTILFVVFAGYALFGDQLPGRFGHGGVQADFLIETLYLSTDGIWGILMDIFVSILVLFVAFSGLMIGTGASQTFVDLAKSIGGRFSGGPAKISVIASAIMGSITGSSVSNVAMTGNFTIPMMKRLGRDC